MGRVIHFEIHAGDPDRAQRFYESVFGWSITRYEGTPVDYRLITTGTEAPGIDGAILQRQGEVDGQAVIAFVCTVQVDDLAATQQAVADAGGEEVVAPDDIPGVGRLAYFKDTEGNIFGALQPAG